MDTDLEPGNAAACKRYYARNTEAAKKRVLLSDIRTKGRLPTQHTLSLWNITIHEVIDAYRIYRQNCIDETPKKLAEFRVLVGNML